jgi:tetratricopeptide (TPR) repeat protein
MACSGVPPLDSTPYSRHPPRAALTAVPWFPEDPYQCGPQSLASLLSASGIATTPDSLVDDVYVPGRKGSFAPELRAAARARGRLPYRVNGSLDALLAALADGYPVLILQNLGLGFAPTWHFAVVIGYDRAADVFMLRSGPHEQLAMDTSRFERRWRLGEYWGIVLLGPDDLPRWVELAEYESQLAYLEGRWTNQMPGIYSRMAARWPSSTTAHLGLGNLAFGRGDLAGAEDHFRRVLEADGDNIAALNNLAEVSARQGRTEQAFDYACRALSLARGHPLEAPVMATINELRQKHRRDCPIAAGH